MIGSLKRGVGYVLAGAGLLIAAAIGLGLFANVLVGIVQLAVGLTAFTWVAVGSGAAGALVLLWLWDRRR